MNTKLGLKAAGRLAVNAAIAGAIVATPMAVFSGPALADATPGVVNADRDHHGDNDWDHRNNGPQGYQPWTPPPYVPPNYQNQGWQPPWQQQWQPPWQQQQWQRPWQQQQWQPPWQQQQFNQPLAPSFNLQNFFSLFGS